MKREGNPFAEGLGRQLLAGVANLQHRPEDVVVHLRAAVRDFVGAGMPLHVAISRLRLGSLIGGDEGARLTAEGEGWLKSEGVVEPGRLAAVLAPGFD